MAILSMFYGLIISMYYADNKRHNLPHIHLLDGNLPPKKIPLVKAWIVLHEDELMANWELATSEQNIFPVEPLR